MNPLPKIQRHNFAFRFVLLCIGRPVFWLFYVSYKIGLLHDQPARVRGLVIYNGHTLLVREAANRDRWSLPGGGIKQTERSEQALSRELYEELAIAVEPKSYQFLATFSGTAIDAPHDIHVFVVTIPITAVIKVRHELLDARWFKLDDLPQNLGPDARLAVQKYA